MAILDLKEKIEPFRKNATGYVKQLLSADHVIMSDGTTLQTKMDSLNSALEKINKTSGILTLNYDYGCYYYKNGNVVTITIDFGNKSVPQSGIILGTFEEKYRPSLDVFARNSYDNQNGKIYVFKNGNVGIISSSGQFNYMTATLSYVAATGFDM